MLEFQYHVPTDSVCAGSSRKYISLLKKKTCKDGIRSFILTDMAAWCEIVSM